MRLRAGLKGSYLSWTAQKLARSSPVCALIQSVCARAAGEKSCVHSVRTSSSRHPAFDSGNASTAGMYGFYAKIGSLKLQRFLPVLFAVPLQFGGAGLVLA